MATVLEEAQSLIYGDRAEEYGSASAEFERVARGWETILKKDYIAETDIALCMTWLKIVRETHKHSRDNIVDAVGYLGLVEKVINGE